MVEICSDSSVMDACVSSDELCYTSLFSRHDPSSRSPDQGLINICVLSLKLKPLFVRLKKRSIGWLRTIVSLILAIERIFPMLKQCTSRPYGGEPPFLSVSREKTGRAFNRSCDASAIPHCTSSSDVYNGYYIPKGADTSMTLIDYLKPSFAGAIVFLNIW